MKIVVFEDELHVLDIISNIILNYVKDNPGAYELYLATDDITRLRRTMRDLDETAVYFIDIVHRGAAIGLDLIHEIYNRNKADFIIVLTKYPEKVLFQPHIKMWVLTIIIKELRNRTPEQNVMYMQKEIQIALSHINHISIRESDIGFLYASKRFKSFLRVSYEKIS